MPARQVLSGYARPQQLMVFGCSMPSKYACWASLTITALLVPKSSLRGHLCGVVSGLVLVFVPHAGASCVGDTQRC